MRTLTDCHIVLKDSNPTHYNLCPTHNDFPLHIMMVTLLLKTDTVNPIHYNLCPTHTDFPLLIMTMSPYL